MSDLISRKDAIDALGERPVVWSDNDDYTLGERNQYDMDRHAIGTVPSAEPERKNGKWIYGENDCQDGWFCSACGEFIPWDYDYYGSDCDFIRDFKTCPFCDAKMISYTGADMRGEEDEAD